MSNLPDVSFFGFQILQQFWWWWILVFLAAAVCFGWPAAVLVTGLLFWRATEIFLTWQMLHYVNRR